LQFQPKKILLWALPAVWLGCGGGGGTDVALPSLSISTTTTGVELDADGYAVEIDGGQGQAIGLNATFVVERLADGAHSVALSGLAPNCVPQDDNPRTVSISTGSPATVAFAVTCTASSGSIEVVTATSGSGSDPDGFGVLLDGTDLASIEVSGTVDLGGLAPGPHVLGLTGVAGNCQVTGQNPLQVTVNPGEKAQVPFSITCATPGPTAGSLQIVTSTSGADWDPDGYAVTVDGGRSQPIGLDGRLILANLSAAAHRVQLSSVATNCSVSGANPARVTVPSGGSVDLTFAVVCAPIQPATGGIQVSVATSGTAIDPDGYTLSVDNGTGQSISANGSRTVSGLQMGTHSALLSGVAANCTVSGDNPRPVTVNAGQTTQAAFAVTCVAIQPGLNLRIERVTLTQSTQSSSGDVPLVQGREGYARVFVTASGANTSRPAVRLRFYQGGSLSQTFTILPPAASTPTAMQEGVLSSSWNVRVPASVFQSNAAMLADVDPDNTVAETNEGDNSFPTSGVAQAIQVRASPAAAIRFVPVLQSANGLQGSVGGNPDRLIQLARRMYPLGTIQADVHAVFTATGPVQPDNGNNEWNQILGDVDALRVADGSNRTYFGLVKLDYINGIVGMGFVGTPTAIGTDNPDDVLRVTAHELGHTWGRFHSPCGNPGDLDPNQAYPYPNGQIGVYGLDIVAQSLKPPTTPDIMGYCFDPWISDYTYKKVMAFRESSAISTGTPLGEKQPALLVWGHIVNGQPVLEPAFQILTRPSLPGAPGPYSIEAIGADGSRLFALSFDAKPLADDPQESRHFAFAVPLDPGRAARLSRLQLIGPGARTAGMSQSVARLDRRAAVDQVIAQREPGGRVRVQWNAAANPMVMVRDPDTGEVLSFARGGDAGVWTTKGEVDLEVSNGVQSQRVRRAISRP
jgi:hypothetical protein